MRINALVAKAQKVPDDGWTMQDGTPWPGNNVRDHPGMIQVNTSVHTKLPSIVKVLLVIVFGANDVWFHLFSGIFGAKWRA